ncbi:MAG: DNA-directed RNA polymerase subunit P [Candidatus Aenigmarchaeota archaeon]|nr:DNA-directed RNA polymerase subunit P [Candidatus Aenigmarchaeota archaeon]
MYKCLKCGEKVDMKQIKEKVRCPYCGYKIITKETPKNVVTVSSD